MMALSLFVSAVTHHKTSKKNKEETKTTYRFCSELSSELLSLSFTSPSNRGLNSTQSKNHGSIQLSTYYDRALEAAQTAHRLL